MLQKTKIISFFLIFLSTFIFINKSFAEEEEIYLKSISDQIQVITKDLKTLEKAVYQKSDAATSSKINSIKSDGLNEDIMTKHLLKLNEIEDQFRELTNKFEEINFKLDKLSNRMSKVQADNQIRFQDLENSFSSVDSIKKITKKTEDGDDKILPGSSQPQDLGSISYKDTATQKLFQFLMNNQIN